jgi:hypothetical protein
MPDFLIKENQNIQCRTISTSVKARKQTKVILFRPGNSGG